MQVVCSTLAWKNDYAECQILIIKLINQSTRVTITLDPIVRPI